jgi:hypothetical protein
LIKSLWNCSFDFTDSSRISLLINIAETFSGNPVSKRIVPWPLASK